MRYYVKQSLKGIRSVNVLRSMYFADFQSHSKYSIHFWEVIGKVKKFLNYKKKVHQ